MGSVKGEEESTKIMRTVRIKMNVQWVPTIHCVQLL